MNPLSRDSNPLAESLSLASVIPKNPEATFHSNQTGSPQDQFSSVLSSGRLSTRTKVLFVNRSYWPDIEATGQLLTELCQTLANEDHYEVAVLCGQPNFSDGSAFKARGTQIRNKVTIRRTSHTQFDKSNFWGRAVNFLSFCVCAFFSLLFGKRPDVIVCQTDPPLSPIAACLVSIVRRTKFVCYLQDIYPDIAVACGKVSEGFFIKTLRKLLVWCYCRADRVVVVSNDMKQWLQHHGVAPEKIQVIHNWVDIQRLTPIKANNPFREEQLLEGKFVVMYSGNIGQTQRFDMLLDAAERLREHANIVFLIIGGGVRQQDLIDAASDRKLHNVRFLNYQPKEKLSESLSAADIQLVLLDQRMTQLMMPSKLYSALASGTPVIGIGDRQSHLAEIIHDHHCGWFFSESELDALVAQIEQASQNPVQIQKLGAAARQLVVSEFSRSASVLQFRQLLNEVAGVGSLVTREATEVQAGDAVQQDSPENNENVSVVTN